MFIRKSLKPEDEANQSMVQDEYYKVNSSKVKSKQNLREPEIENLQTTTQPSVFLTTEMDIVSERKERGNSIIRDGYEIVVEAIYVVNGKKKKKIRKKKLTNFVPL